MADVGILRINIKGDNSGPGGWRFIWAKERQPAANRLYRQIFDGLGIPLLPGYEEIECSKEDFEAGYDYALGIDVILTLDSGGELTMQEKFLSYSMKTVTVEHMQDWRTGERGDWFNLKAQLYFVGYDRIKALDFQDWILLNWPRVKMTPDIWWQEKFNQEDGARASFLCSHFNNFSGDCVIARSSEWPPNRERQLTIWELLNKGA